MSSSDPSRKSSPYAALYGELEKQDADTKNIDSSSNVNLNSPYASATSTTSNPTISPTKTDTPYQHLNLPESIPQQSTQSPTTNPSLSQAVTNKQTSQSQNSVVPFSSMLPTNTNISGQVGSTPNTPTANPNPYATNTPTKSGGYNGLLQTNEAKRQHLKSVYYGLAVKNYEILPTFYRYNFNLYNYVYAFFNIGLFIYFFANTNKFMEGTPRMKLAFIMKTCGGYILVGTLTSIGQQYTAIKAFDVEFGDLDNMIIEKKLDECKEAIPIVKL